MSNVATVQKKLARHKAFMTHSVEKRLGDIFSLSHSPRDSEERKGGGFTKVEPLHRSAKLLDVQYACLNGTKSAPFFSPSRLL